MATSNMKYTFRSLLRSISSLSASSSVSFHVTAYYSSPFLLTASLYSFAIPLFCKLQMQSSPLSLYHEALLNQYSKSKAVFPFLFVSLLTKFTAFNPPETRKVISQLNSNGVQEEKGNWLSKGGRNESTSMRVSYAEKPRINKPTCSVGLL